LGKNLKCQRAKGSKGIKGKKTEKDRAQSISPSKKFLNVRVK
jgi:hypothetical protein